MANNDPTTTIPVATPKPEFININVHKAGLDGLDQEKINKIIQEASKGSNFYSFQQKRQKRIAEQINQLKEKLSKISEQDRRLAGDKADVLMLELESRRVLNKIIVHFDMDMFFAACEIKKDPSLAEKPMAVGSLAMISTSNYLARKFGVRSAMAGFIAKKLCPQLILIKPNFRHYSAESEIVMNIISEYDPNLRNFSLDEVYIDLTDYVFQRYSFENENVTVEQLQAMDQLGEDVWRFAFNIVNDIRKRIQDETKLTISAGISCNTMLAKVCTDINKPNGQFMVKGDREEILKFVHQTELRKFTGIGPVRGQILAAFNVIKAADIHQQRSLLFSLFSELNVRFYFRVYLGIGSSCLNEDEPSVQKSHSRERTVNEMGDFNGICSLLKDLSVRLAKDLLNEMQYCRTITLKLKKTTFEVFIKSRTIDKFTQDENLIYQTAKELLSQEFAQHPLNKYRLVGLKASNLSLSSNNNRIGWRAETTTTTTTIDSNQSTLSQYLTKSNPQQQLPNVSANQTHETLTSCMAGVHECVLCDQMFDDISDYEMHKYYCDGDFLMSSPTLDNDEVNVGDGGGDGNGAENPEEAIYSNLEDCSNSESNPSAVMMKNDAKRTVEEQENDEIQYLKCPICQSSTLFASNADLNRHIDICLNRECCIELTTFSNKPSSSSSPSSLSSLSDLNGQPSWSASTNLQAKRNKPSSSSSSSSPTSATVCGGSSKKSNNHKKRCNQNSRTAMKTTTAVDNQPRIDHYFH